MRCARYRGHGTGIRRRFEAGNLPNRQGGHACRYGDAANLDIDLVAMGTLARTGVSGLIIGNTAEGIINSIGCAVLVVKPEGFVSPLEPDA